MAKGHARKPVQQKPLTHAAEVVALPPGLAPPGLAVSYASAGKAVNTIDIPMPPGLAPPPGLEMVEECGAPGHSTITRDLQIPLVSATGQCEVLVTGLSNAMLSDVMFEAILHQARLDGQYASFKTIPRASSGEALISLYSESAAERCMSHFQGRPWGPHGKTVHARLLQGKKEKTRQQPMRLEPSWAHLDNGTAGAISNNFDKYGSSTRFSADAPVFVPGALHMSSMTPAFITGCVTEMRTALDDKFVNASDVSTADGESDVESAKEIGAHEMAV
jgi:hypothetical protein